MVRAPLWLLLIVPLREFPGSSESNPDERLDHTLQFATKQLAASVAVFWGFPPVSEEQHEGLSMGVRFSR